MHQVREGLGCGLVASWVVWIARWDGDALWRNGSWVTMWSVRELTVSRWCKEASP